MLTSPGGVHSYCSLLRMGFDAIFGDLLFLKCLFSLYMSVFMLTLIFYLRNFPLEQFGVRNVGLNSAKAISMSPSHK
jgi:hypothetical protein